MFVVAASCLGSSSGTRQSRFMRRCWIRRSSRAPQVIPTCFVFCRRCVWGEKKSIYLLIRYASVFDCFATLRLCDFATLRLGEKYSTQRRKDAKRAQRDTECAEIS